MTITIDRSDITAVDGDDNGARRNAGGGHARALSPRLAGGRSAIRRPARAGLQGVGTAAPNRSTEPVRTSVAPVPAPRRTAAPARPHRTVRRSPVGASRRGACARRTPPSLLLCVAVGVGAVLVFFALVSLAGWAQGPATGGGAAPAGTPAMTSLVTVRDGQSLEQVAAQIAPDRPVAEVTAAIAEINGLDHGAVHAGQTLVTPRY